ncbi:hypothetical protein [Pseudomonas pseudonitroreducens]|uniref:hypothetical protein n=1 Tax=Pseudomonas pseudonitroreducens TaxID=2892326 RepID=UPI001F43AE35|nr:hypothetical protein [Pseudomonas pseudonitroreducens]
MGVFSTAQERLESIYGKMQRWDSGNGVRCTNDVKGHVTLYSKNLASGNLAELAFEINGLAARAGRTTTEAKAFLESLRCATGQPVNIDPRHKWPRVGFAKQEHVDLVISALAEYFPE